MQRTQAWRNQDRTVSPSLGYGGSSVFGILPIAAVLAVGALFSLAMRTFYTLPTITVESKGGTAAVAAPDNGGIAAFFTPEVHYWEAEIVAWAKQWGLDPNLVATVMQIESCGDPQALSSAGAMGLFQVMPYHFADGEDPYSPTTNAARGLSYLASALEGGAGQARLAFAGYNGGINGATRPESQWPAETQRYTYWGTHIYQDAQTGASSSPVLDEWLGSGGFSLCAQAALRLGLAP